MSLVSWLLAMPGLVLMCSRNPGLFDRLEAPLWSLEARLFWAFQWLTTRDRKTLRWLLLTIAVLCIGVAFAIAKVSVAERMIHLTSLFFVIALTQALASLPSAPSARLAILRAPTLASIVANMVGVCEGCLRRQPHIALGHVAALLACLHNYVLWAEHRQPPRKRKATLPDLLKAKFAASAPRPVPNHSRVLASDRSLANVIPRCNSDDYPLAVRYDDHAEAASSRSP